MRDKREVAITQDVIQRAMDKTGMSGKQITSVYNFMIHQLKQKSLEVGEHSVKWCGLGTFYVRRKALIRKLKSALRHYNTGVRKEMIEKLRNKLDYLATIDNNWLYQQEKRISNMYLRNRMTDEELQKEQNNFYEKQNRKS
mgnify:CR=1 FL=1